MQGIYNTDLPTIKKFAYRSAPIIVNSIVDLFYTLKNYHQSTFCDRCLEHYRWKPPSFHPERTTPWGQKISSFYDYELSCKCCAKIGIAKESKFHTNITPLYRQFNNMYCCKCIRKHPLKAIRIAYQGLFLIDRRNAAYKYITHHISIQYQYSKLIINIYPQGQNTSSFHTCYYNKITGELRGMPGHPILMV